MNKENIAQRIANQVRKAVSEFLPKPGTGQSLPEQDPNPESTEVVFPKDGVIQTYDKDGNPIDSRSVYDNNTDRPMGL